jgi:tetratricopeptide (TPR) repeat protein
LQVLSEWGRAAHLADCPLSRFVFLDTETTGLGGGTGTLAFLVGLGHITPDGFRLVQLLLRGPHEEPAMLASLAQFLDPFQAIVTYNGKSFDIPLLNTRHVLNGFTSPFTSLDHLDLLPLARRVWRNRLASRSLSNLEQEIIGVPRTQDEVPGWMIPQIYFDYLRTGDAHPLQGVLYHNAMDILSLAAVFHHTAGLLSDPLGSIEPNSLDLIAIARLYEELGHFDQAVDLYEYSLQAGLPEEFFIQTLQRFADLYRRRNQWEQTLILWEKASHHHHIESCVELAKYYEHHAREYSVALRWTETALQYIELYVSGRASRNLWKQDLTHRQERIQRKLGV